MVTNVYVKDEERIYVGDTFKYEVLIYCHFENISSIVNSTIYESKIPLDYIPSFFINRNIEITCWFIEAPLDYLINNNYKIYEPKVKTKRTKNLKK